MISKILLHKLLPIAFFAFLSITKYIYLISKYYQLINGKTYINKCLQQNYYNRKFHIKNSLPKISVIIPVFNCENSISLSVSSIQNQRLLEIEIILVNDFSKDNSRFIIEEMQKSDSRIVIINNNKNMGTLYSRNIGAIYAQGSYIFCLDNDDMFLRDNIFLRLYNIELKFNYDILGFKIINGDSYNADISSMHDDPFISKKNDMIVYQPNLKLLSIKNNDVHIWGKCIKNEVFKKAISLLGNERSATYLCNAEDDVIVLMLFNAAKSFRFIPIYGIFHFLSKKTTTYTLPKDHILFSRLFFLDLLYDITDNVFSEKQYVVNNAIIVKKFISSKNLTFNKKNTIYLKKILRKIFSCDKIKDESKAYLKTIF